ncbi:hypothetical protein H8959_002904, partial [Pygathrix nigripes]
GSRTEASHKMILLDNSEQLLALFESLARSIPESLKVKEQWEVGFLFLAKRLLFVFLL